MNDNDDKLAMTQPSSDEIKTGNVIRDFIQAYRKKTDDESNTAWLDRQFAQYPELWPDVDARKKDAAEIVNTVERYHAAKAELDEHLKRGGSHEKYIISKIEASATAVGVVNVGQYAKEIDSAISKANAAMAERLFTQSGNIDMNPQLKGNIMESDHVATFNIDAAAKESKAVAEAQISYGKNSVDIKVAKADGGTQRYQAKCCDDAEKAEAAFRNGDYRGQRKLVAKGQTDEVPNSTDHLEADGVKSTARTNEEYKKMQAEAQQKGKIPEYDWSSTNKVAVAKAIGKKAAWAGVMAVGFQGARILGRRAWNWMTGKKNQSADEDLKEFVSSSIQSAGGAGLAVAVSGGVTVAVKSGWLGKALRGTPAGAIANAVCVGVENVKILYKLGKGEITGAQALDQAGNATCSLLGGMVGGAKGAAIGASLGTVLGPVGTAIGGVAGAVAGGIAGSTVGEAIYSGAKKVVTTIKDKVTRAISKVGSAVSTGVRALASFLGF